ncbi:MAG: hypothetical protein E7168_01970 [Firmicutes bacterium]|nr:hypothetical protein [Bacillota bacterium]
MGWFLDRKDPKSELEGIERAQKILDERYERHQVPEEVYRKQCMVFMERRQKYEEKLRKQGKL